MLSSLSSQSYKPTEIIIVDSSSDDGFVAQLPDAPLLQKITIPRADFNHGGTRDSALRLAKGDYIFFLTQDALPINDLYINTMMQEFLDPEVAMVTGRQIAKDDATPQEQLIRAFNYPDHSFVRTQDDIPAMGIKAFFASDVCSAYRRSAYLAIGGFEHVSTNEDMFIAAEFLLHGWKVAYSSDAAVRHSHNFNFGQQYRRNFAIGKEMETHRALLGDVPVSSEGFALVKYVVHGLAQANESAQIPRFFLDCVARVLGNKFGTLAGKIAKRQKTPAQENQQLSGKPGRIGLDVDSHHQ